MAETAPDYADVDYSDGEGEEPDEYPHIQDKIEKAIEVTREGLAEYENPAVMWTGGKDSTLTLYFIKEVADRFDLEVPPAVFIDHYQHFDEIHDFVDHWADEWDLEVIYARNEDVGEYVDEHGLEPGDDIDISDLSDHNQHHVREILEYEEDAFPFLLDTYVGNHLLKTVALNDALEEHDIDGVISGVRWDEQEARADETFFSPRHDPDIYPPHDRIQPILQFDEAAVWEAFWNFVVPDTVENFPEEATSPRPTTTSPRRRAGRRPDFAEVLRRLPLAGQRSQHREVRRGPRLVAGSRGNHRTRRPRSGQGGPDGAPARPRVHVNAA